MNLLRFAKWIVFLTVLALVYINMQMQIIELAYRGKAKENQIRKLIEFNSYLNSNILSLKSSNNLGDKLLADNKQMQFLAPQSIVEVSIQSKPNERKTQTQNSLSKNAHALLSFLPLGGEAYAGWGR